MPIGPTRPQTGPRAELEAAYIRPSNNPRKKSLGSNVFNDYRAKYGRPKTHVVTPGSAKYRVKTLLGE